jgi:hypothetical protein
MRGVAAASLLIMACGAQATTPSTGGGPPDAQPPASVPMKTRTFEASSEPILNPERGWMDGAGIGLVDNASYDSIRASGKTLAYAKIRLDRFRAAPLDDAFLRALAAGFDRVRQAGIKVVLRFVYNDAANQPDAPLQIVEQHITQLAPVLREKADVIAVVQAGFIGSWGEWHGSTNGLETPAARKAVLEGLLKATPRSVQVRTPRFKKDLLPAERRVGHHNDCFLASDTDQGTYEGESDKVWLEGDAKTTVVGGETCNPNPPRSECTTALAELARFRFTFLNDGYHPDVLASWASCKATITNKLGYRLILREVSWSETVRPGGLLHLRARIENEGFAPPFNPRKVVLAVGSSSVALRDVDPRTWDKEGIIDVTLRIPALAAGTYPVTLSLPDEMIARPEYAIRFANAGLWKDGAHQIIDALRVEGTPETEAKELTQP